jgi:oligoribonuclease NrnB/cAMP/cGMP phosphodiesterase (DHH superfamily)
MKIENKITTIVTHKNATNPCPDGIASAIILSYVFPRTSFVFLNQSSKDYLDLPAVPGMLFCDICPPKHRVQEFVNVGAYVLDHHSHSESIVKEFKERGVFASEVLEPGVSGAVLAYREIYELYFGKDKKEKFARLAGVRDCWINNSPEWVEACQQACMLEFFGFEYFQKPFIRFPSDSDVKIGEFLYNKKIEKAKETAEKQTIFNDEIAIVTATGTEVDDVSKVIFETHPEVSIVAGFQHVIDQGNLKIIISLRSCGEVDVGMIAKKYSGGGHKHAAGFSLPTDSIGIGDICRTIYYRLREQEISFIGLSD